MESYVTARGGGVMDPISGKNILHGFFQVRRFLFFCFHGQDDVSVRAVDIWKQSIGKMEDTCGGRQVFSSLKLTARI